jgi:glycosyltransferase involved in cell wall biosynthesis
VQGLSRALLARDDVARLSVVYDGSSVLAGALPYDDRLRTVAVDLPTRGRIAWRVAWQVARLGALIRSERADALLCFGGMLARHPRCRVISFVSNALAYEQPRGVGNAIRRGAIARTARRSHQVYAPSQAMAELIAVPNVKVVPHGVNRGLFWPAGPPGDEVLAVGDFYPHKRYDLVLAAWELLPEPRPRLCLIGNPAVNQAYFEKIRRSARDPRAVVAGYVSRDELVKAYRRARVLVLPSEHESFAVPIAEALASGVPAVVRDLPALRATGGPGALYVVGDDPRAWADAIQRVVAEDATHSELRVAGIRHAEAFTWPRVAETVMADLQTPAG